MGGGGKKTVGYWYKLKLLFGLCQGPVDEFVQWDVDDATAWAGSVTSNGSIWIHAENLFGGEDEQGGIEGEAEIMFGRQDQQLNPWLPPNLGAAHSAYRGLVTVLFKGGRWSAFTPYPKSPSFVLRRIKEGWQDGVCWYPEKVKILLDKDASEVVSGFRSVSWSLPCIDMQGSFCTVPGDSEDSFTLNGTGATVFQVGLRISGSVETKYYSGGFPMPGSPSFIKGGTGSGSILPNHNVYRLEISNPPATYHLNYTPNFESSRLILDGAPLNVEVASNATVRLQALTIDGLQDAPSQWLTARVESLDAKVPLVGMNAAHILYDSITHESMGAEPISVIDDASFRAAADVFFEEGMGLCPIYDPDRESIEQYQQRICDAAGAVLVQGMDGRYRLNVPRGKYVLDELPVLTDDDILDWAEEPATMDNACNQLFVKYFDPVENAIGTTPALQSLGAIQAFGSVISEKEDRSGEVANMDLALKIGARNLRAKATSLRKFDLTTTPVARTWSPGSYFRLQAPRRGIADMVCLMGEKRGGTLKSGAITFSCSEDVYSQPNSVYVGTEPGGKPPSTAPTVSPHQVAMEVPYLLLVSQLSAADLAQLSSDVSFLLAASAPPTVGQYFRLMAQAGGAEYSYRGRGDWCASAALVEEAGYRTETFTLTDPLELGSVAVGDIALVGAEICRVDAIDPTAMTLTLGRGCADTVPHLHAPGARVLFLTDIATDTTEYVGGDTVHAKLLTRGASALTDLAEAQDLVVEMEDRQARPYPPADVHINGELYPEDVVGDAVLSWAHRDRVAQADQLVDTGMASIGPEPGTTYTVTVYDAASGALVVSYLDLVGTSFTVPAGQLVERNRVLLSSRRDGLDSWQSVELLFRRVYQLDFSISAWRGANNSTASLVFTTEAEGVEWSIDQGVLPAGMSLNSAAGRIEGMPLGGAPGYYPIRVKGQDAAGNVGFADTEIALSTMRSSFPMQGGYQEAGGRAVAVGSSNLPVLDPTQSPYAGGASVRFNGTGLRQELEAGLGTADFSVAMWIRPDAAPSDTYARLFQIGPNTTNGGLYLRREQLTNPMQVGLDVFTGGNYVRLFNDAVLALTENRLPNAAWSHLAISRRDGVARIFKDGRLVDESILPAAAVNLSQTALSLASNTTLTTERLYAGLAGVEVHAGAAVYWEPFTPPAKPSDFPARLLEMPVLPIALVRGRAYGPYSLHFKRGTEASAVTWSATGLPPGVTLDVDQTGSDSTLGGTPS